MTTQRLARGSVDSIPSWHAKDQSRGRAAEAQAAPSIEGLTGVAIELVTAARGLELRTPLRPGPATAAAVSALRAAGVPGPGSDRWLAPEIEAAVQLVAGDELITAVESVTGELT